MSKKWAIALFTLSLCIGAALWFGVGSKDITPTSNVLTGEIKANQLPTLEGQQQLNDYFLTILQAENRTRGWFFNTKEDSTAEEEKSSNSVMDQSANLAGADVSETNVQVQGIDEADIVKTDGEYIYQINEAQVHIISSLSKGKMERVSTLSFDSTFQPSQLFLDGRQLVILGSSYHTEEVPSTMDGPEEQKVAIYPPVNDRTTVYIYDISQADQPALVREVSVDGGLVHARKIDGKVYVVSSYYPAYWTLEEAGNIDLRPRIKDSLVSDQATSLPYDKIQYFPGSKESNFTTIAAFDVREANTAAEITTYLGSGQQLYMSKENLYLAIENWGEADWTNPEISVPNTKIYKFAVRGLQVTFQTSTEVAGTILNQFSMDEHQGMFRVATTEGFTWDESKPSKNHLLIFNENLEQIGALTDLAKGERIYSARFLGERVYMVTFKETDPLFVIDTSTPTEPKVLGELKIPGFSNYLHPLDGHHLIGVGYETKLVMEKGQTEPLVLTEGVKLSLFDVSDVTNPKEKFTEIIGGRGTYSALNYDHKALLFNRNTGLFAFPINVYHSAFGSDYEQVFDFQGAYVYNVSIDGGFLLKKKISHMEGKPTYEEWGSEIQRLLYINEELYALSPNKITATSLKDYRQLAELELK